MYGYTVASNAFFDIRDRLPHLRDHTRAADSHPYDHALLLPPGLMHGSPPRLPIVSPRTSQPMERTVRAAFTMHLSPASHESALDLAARAAQLADALGQRGERFATA